MSSRNQILFRRQWLGTVDSIDELFSIIDRYQAEGGLCRVVSGPGWAIGDDIVIEGKTLRWAKDVVSIHKIQGFDLNPISQQNK